MGLCQTCCGEVALKIDESRTELKEKYEKLKSQYQTLTNHYNSLLKQKQNLLNELNKITFLEGQLRQKEGEKNKLSHQLKQIQNVQQMQGNQINYSQHQKIANDKLKSVESQLKQLQNEKSNLLYQLSLKKQNNQSNKTENNRLTAQNEDLKRQLRNCLSQMEQNQIKYENEIQALKNQIQNLQFQKTQRNTLISTNNNIRQYFHGDILQDDERDYLLTTLQNRLSKNIKKTNLVYRYDPHNQVNIHDYIDNKENLVFIIKLTNGFSIAAWTQGGFKPGAASEGDGLLISLTNKKSFEPKDNTQVVAYERYWVVFGNSEIRFKTQEDKIASNFGYNNTVFRTEGNSVDSLLGTNNREVKLKTYDVYQLQL